MSNINWQKWLDERAAQWAETKAQYRRSLAAQAVVPPYRMPTAQMAFSGYPRPANGSKRGWHWTASCYPGHPNFQWHLDWMVRCGTGWVKYVADGNGNVGSGDSGVQFGVECLRRGMMPIHRFYWPADHRWTDANSYAVEACVRAGIVYLEPMNEPDLLKVEWDKIPSVSEWLTRAFDTWMDQARRISQLGGIPLTPALASGAFQERGPDAGQVTVNPFMWVREAGIDNFVCAIHNYMGNHPANYPYDAVNQEGAPLVQAEYDKYGAETWDNRSIESINAERWNNKNPGDTIDDDDSCFLAVVKFRQLLDEAGFAHVPIMTTEGGPVHTDLWDGRYPRVVPRLFIEMLEAELRWMADKDWYYCLCPWLWANSAAGGTGGWSDCQVYHPGHPWVDSDGFMPGVRWLIARPISDDGNTDIPEQPEEPPDEEEPDMPEPDLVLEPPDILERYNLVIVPVADTVPGEQYYKLIHVKHYGVGENGGDVGRRNLYMDVLDENGQRIYGATIAVHNGDINTQAVIDKPANEPGTNVPMEKGDTLTVWIDGTWTDLQSDVLSNVHTRWPDEGFDVHLYHHSFLAVWQRITKAEEEPEEPEEPTETLEQFIRRKSWDRVGVNYNPTAALSIYAAEHGLGKPETQEFDVAFTDARIYRIQAFTGGIVYCIFGDWQNVKVLAW